jgi:hypothetical protein
LELYPAPKHVPSQTKIDLSKDFPEKNVVRPLMNLFHTLATHCIIYQ